MMFETANPKLRLKDIYSEISNNMDSFRFQKTKACKTTSDSFSKLTYHQNIPWKRRSRKR